MIELLLEAERALSFGRVDEAERLYRQVAASDPANSIAVVGLARVALEHADDAGAYLLARKALTIDPENEAAQRLVTRLDEVMRTRGETVPEPPDAVGPPPARRPRLRPPRSGEPAPKPPPPLDPGSPPRPLTASGRIAGSDRSVAGRVVRTRFDPGQCPSHGAPIAGRDDLVSREGTDRHVEPSTSARPEIYCCQR